MEQQQVELATEIVIESISNSNLEPLTKLELLINLKLFFKDYNNNIRILNQNKPNKAI